MFLIVHNHQELDMLQEYEESEKMQSTWVQQQG